MGTENDNEIIPEIDPKRLQTGLSEVYELFDGSSAVEELELREIFREWNSKNLDNFSESDDEYFSIIDDFLSRSGKFESMMNGPKVDHQKKVPEMEASIETQRQLINLVGDCISFDVKGDLVVLNTQKFEQILITMNFLDKVVNELLTKEQYKSKTQQAGSYLSGLKSMVCASVMARGAGFSVSFGPEKYDVENDLDMIISRRNKKIGLDVTTRPLTSNAKYGFSLFLDDNRSNITNNIAEELGLTNRSKLLLPSYKSAPEFYDPDKRRSNLGLPSNETLANFRRVTS